MRWSAWALVLFVACVRRGADGQSLDRLDPCQTSGRSVSAPQLDEAIEPCRRHLLRAPSDSVRAFLGLSTDDEGRVNRVCLYASSEAADSPFLVCVRDQLQHAPAALPGDLRDASWSLSLEY